MALPIIPNIALGKVAYYAGLPAANDALIAVPLESSGLEADTVLKDYDTLAAILAASNNEQTNLGRKTLASVTVTVDDTGNVTSVDCANPVWSGYTAGNNTGALVICYDPDTTAGTDSDLIPLFIDAFVTTPAGQEITYTVHADGFYEAA